MCIAYCYFHLGEYKSALEEYEKIMDSYTNESGFDSDDVWVYIACCQFYLGMYNESKISANKSNKKSQLFNRLMFHLCHKFGDENETKQYHQQLQV